MNVLLKKAVAEGFGTLILVLFGVGVAVITNANIIAVALTFGLVIIAMAYTIGNVSGCHINPAVSLAKLLNKELTLKEFIVYVASQLVGALIGALLLYGMIKANNLIVYIDGTNSVLGTDTAGIITSIAIEAILTLVFVYVILVITSSKENGKIAGFVIGLTLVLVHFVGINLTGASVNPARSIGPALMAWLFDLGTTSLEQVYVFIIGPLLGSVLAVLLFKLFNKEQ